MRPSSDRGQAEPLAALVAVVAVGLGLSLYVGVLDAELPASADRNLAEPALERVEAAIAPAGIARPGSIDEAQRVGPDGYELNVTLAVDDHRWQTGPPLPPGRDEATTRLAVRESPATIMAGTLEVRIWT